MELAREEFGLETEQRQVGRTELYVADEVFLTGTGFQIAPVVEIDDRPVGNGRIGDLASNLQRMYFQAARGEWDKYQDWTVPVEVAEQAVR
jgi:branched-chain amino acid aminotransferase